MADGAARSGQKDHQSSQPHPQAQTRTPIHAPLIRRNTLRSTHFARCELDLFALALLTGLLGCPKEPKPQPKPQLQPAPQAPTVALEPLDEIDEIGVPYDCAGLEQPDDHCAATPGWVVALHALGNSFQPPKGEGPSAEDCQRAHAALDAALTSQETLTLEERIVAQNGALRLYGPQNCDAHMPGLADKARRVVRHLAPGAKALGTLGEAPFSDLEMWLGSPSTWIDRQTKHLLLMHDQHEFFTRRFRPIETQDRRAIFGQLVAIDSSGDAHLTPIVSRVELRRSKAPDAPACVGKLVPERLRCAKGRLLPRPLAQLTENQFITKVGDDRVECDRCHDSPATDANLAPITDPQHLQKRHAAFMKEARKLSR